MSTEKQYCGSGKIINTQYGEMIKLSFTEKDIEVLKANLSNGWVNCNFKEKQNKVDGKPTHYIEIDAWKPEQKAQPKAKAKKEDSDNLPF